MIEVLIIDQSKTILKSVTDTQKHFLPRVKRKKISKLDIFTAEKDLEYFEKEFL